MKITIRYLMQQPYMNHVKILCGENLLGNVVEGISFLEGNFNNIVMQKNTMILTDTASLVKNRTDPASASVYDTENICHMLKIQRRAY